MRGRRSGVPLGKMTLLALCVALGALVYVELGRELPPLRAGDAGSSSVAPGSKDADASAKPSQAFRPAPIAAYGEVVARPLFNRTRRPIADRSAGPAAGPGGPPLRLVGIVVDAHGPTAFLKIKDAPQVVRAALGGVVDGWTVRSIDGESITLARGGDVTRLTTKRDLTAEERADRSAEKRKPGTAGGKVERPGQKRDDNKD
jgi:hypothetical protein